METSFRFIPTGKNVENRHFIFNLMFFEKRDDTASLLLKKMVNFKPELNLESTTPKNFEFTHPRVSPYVAIEITQESVPKRSSHHFLLEILRIKIPLIA